MSWSNELHQPLHFGVQLPSCMGKGHPDGRHCFDLTPHEQTLCSRNVYVLTKAWGWRKGHLFIQWEDEVERWRRKKRRSLWDWESLGNTGLGNWYGGSRGGGEEKAWVQYAEAALMLLPWVSRQSGGLRYKKDHQVQAVLFCTSSSSLSGVTERDMPEWSLLTALRIVTANILHLQAPTSLFSRVITFDFLTINTLLFFPFQ